MRKISLAILAGIMSIIFCTNVYAGERIETVPAGSSFKPFMSYKAITDKQSPQYLLQRYAETDIWGLRKINGRYLVAMGSYYSTTIGTHIDIVLDNGKVLKCVLGDAKNNKDTDASNKVGPHNDTVEFIVDSKALHENAKYNGDISWIIGFEGDVRTVIVHESEVYLPLDPMLS